MDPLLLWLHLLSLAGYVGATLTLVVVILPATARIEEHRERLTVLTAALARWNPLMIAVLGVLVMSGAFGLTAYKARLRAEYFTLLGEPLALKLALVFVLVMSATYVVFGLAHRLVRAVEWGDPVSPEKLAGMMRRMRATCIVNLALAAWITWVAIRM
jgi:uncharacterized membrane protein